MQLTEGTVSMLMTEIVVFSLNFLLITLILICIIATVYACLIVGNNRK